MTSTNARIAAMVVMMAATSACAGGKVRTAASADLDTLLSDHWEHTLKESPGFATHVGDARYDDQLGEVGEAAEKRRIAVTRAMLERAKRIDGSKLTRQEQISVAIFVRKRHEELAAHAFGAWMMPVSSRWGFHVGFATLPDRQPLETVEDYERYLKRLEAFGRYTDQHIDVMRTGMAKGLVMPKVIMKGLDATATAHVVADPTKSRLYKPFASFPKALNGTDRKRLEEAGRTVINGVVVPAYKRFADFLAKEYIPAGRDSVGISEVPGGKRWYQDSIARFTTLTDSPEAIHATGKQEVARIRAEMEEVIASAKFQGDFAAFVKLLRTDERFYAKTPEQLMRTVALALKRMDGALPKLFARLPRTPYGIKEVPAYIAPRTSTAYYQPPAQGGRTAGFYFVNTYDLKQRPLYEVEALSLHEAVPGHHLQIALAQELEGVPEFRRHIMFGAYVEGWALYAERLGKEVGFYADPYSDFGRLTYEMWRACRLVVDTGMHALGWTRKQAIDYMAANTALSEHNITTEVDRYIGWPGQALGYKLGELKIRALRSRAEKALGARFDVRAFHDVVLRNGSIPLDILEAEVNAWLTRQR